jgi:OOP family OmpA-OmpF porin
MKRILANMTLIASLTAAGLAAAASNGIYVGGGLGYGTIYDSPQDAFVTSVTDGHGGLSGRVFGGYQFTPLIGLEFGYTKFSNTTVYYTNDANFTGNTYTGAASVVTYAIDLVAKGTIPLRNGFSLFGKLGIAGINENPGTVTLTTTADDSTATLDINHNGVFPTFGLGVGYEINKELTTDLSWMRMQHVGNSKVLSTDLVVLGLVYYFG